MKKTRNKTLAGVILLAAVLLITGIAWAEATKIPVTGTMSSDPDIGSAESEWVDDDGVWHIRGMSSELTFLGDLEGEGTGVVNFNIDLSTGNGDEYGEWSDSELTWGELSGGFEGRYSMTYTDFVGIGHAAYQGTGDFDGMKFMTDFTIDLTIGPPYVVNFEGIILDPHGE